MTEPSTHRECPPDNAFRRSRPGAAERPRRRAYWWTAALSLSILCAAQSFSTAHAVAGPVPDTTPIAAARDSGNRYAATVVALLGPEPASALELLPETFAATLGYIPTLIDGYPADPEGSCSSPVPLPATFTPLCRTHDFGYDLLRAARSDGAPLGAWARFSLDRMLVDRMYGSCGSPACTAAAHGARIGLAWNTWRQYGGPPARDESVPALVGTTIERAFVARDEESAS
ncbi:hypothetical protein [Gordonia jinghuaiqii]|uniref:hypothetical protein n=1 Tax=Gordonia jinghuaiqii TaxID=2758710 RepID=UPI001FD6096A|nr:hypothetical protein [Gordonia jinghuaiqii]